MLNTDTLIMAKKKGGTRPPTQLAAPNVENIMLAMESRFALQMQQFQAQSLMQIQQIQAQSTAQIQQLQTQNNTLLQIIAQQSHVKPQVESGVQESTITKSSKRRAKERTKRSNNNATMSKLVPLPPTLPPVDNVFYRKVKKEYEAYTDEDGDYHPKDWDWDLDMSKAYTPDMIDDLNDFSQAGNYYFRGAYPTTLNVQEDEPLEDYPDGEPNVNKVDEGSTKLLMSYEGQTAAFKKDYPITIGPVDYKKQRLLPDLTIDEQKKIFAHNVVDVRAVSKAEIGHKTDEEYRHIVDSISAYFSFWIYRMKPTQHNDNPSAPDFNAPFRSVGDILDRNSVSSVTDGGIIIGKPRAGNLFQSICVTSSNPKIPNHVINHEAAHDNMFGRVKPIATAVMSCLDKMRNEKKGTALDIALVTTFLIEKGSIEKSSIRTADTKPIDYVYELFTSFRRTTPVRLDISLAYNKAEVELYITILMTRMQILMTDYFIGYSSGFRLKYVIKNEIKLTLRPNAIEGGITFSDLWPISRDRSPVLLSNMKFLTNTKSKAVELSYRCLSHALLGSYYGTRITDNKAQGMIITSYKCAKYDAMFELLNKSETFDDILAAASRGDTEYWFIDFNKAYTSSDTPLKVHINLDFAKQILAAETSGAIIAPFVMTDENFDRLCEVLKIRIHVYELKASEEKPEIPFRFARLYGCKVATLDECEDVKILFYRHELVAEEPPKEIPLHNILSRYTNTLHTVNENAYKVDKTGIIQLWNQMSTMNTDELRKEIICELPADNAALVLTLKLKYKQSYVKALHELPDITKDAEILTKLVTYSKTLMNILLVLETKIPALKVITITPEPKKFDLYCYVTQGKSITFVFSDITVAPAVKCEIINALIRISKNFDHMLKTANIDEMTFSSESYKDAFYLPKTSHDINKLVYKFSATLKSDMHVDKSIQEAQCTNYLIDPDYKLDHSMSLHSNGIDDEAIMRVKSERAKRLGHYMGFSIHKYFAQDLVYHKSTKNQIFSFCTCGTVCHSSTVQQAKLAVEAHKKLNICDAIINSLDKDEKARNAEILAAHAEGDKPARRYLKCKDDDKISMPSKDSYMKFSCPEKIAESPFTMSADFETLGEALDTSDQTGVTTKLSEHKAFSYKLIVRDNIKGKIDSCKLYIGDHTDTKFLKLVTDTAIEIHKKIRNFRIMEHCKSTKINSMDDELTEADKCIYCHKHCKDAGTWKVHMGYHIYPQHIAKSYAVYSHVLPYAAGGDKTKRGYDGAIGYIHNKCAEKLKDHSTNCANCCFCKLKFNSPVIKPTHDVKVCKEQAGDKMYYYEPITGRFRGMAHLYCAKAVNELHYGPNSVAKCYFHNLTGFDLHVIIQALASLIGVNDIDVVAQNQEKMMSLTIRKYHLQFCDSMKIMPGSLEDIVKAYMKQADKIIKNINTYKALSDRNVIYLSEMYDDLHRMLETMFPTMYEIFLKLKGVNSFNFIHDESLHKLKVNPELTMEHFIMLLRKNIIPYEYIKSLESLDTLIKDLKITDFDSTLDNNKGIKKKEFDFFIEFAEKFKFTTLGEYVAMYQLIDVALLADMLIFNDKCTIMNDGLAATNFLTISSLGLQSLLRYCHYNIAEPDRADVHKLKKSTTFKGMELINDKTTYLAFAVRGGITCSYKRVSKANNPLIPETYDPSKPMTFLYEMDLNSMYPSASLAAMPIGGFRDSEIIPGLMNDVPELLNKLQRKIVMPITEVDMDYMRLLDHRNREYKWTDDKGVVHDEKIPPCYLFCDIEFPKDKHDYFSEFPPLAEKKTIKPEQISKHQMNMYEDDQGNCTYDEDGTRLIADLVDKRNYGMHYTLMLMALSLGAKITNIHRIIYFDEAPYMRDFMESRAKMRGDAKTEYEGLVIKLIMCAIYGKHCEDPTKYKNIKLLIDNNPDAEQACNDYIAKTYHNKDYDMEELTKDVMIVESPNTDIRLNKPVAVGATILDVSKTLILFYYYYVFKPMAFKKLSVLYGDTDSLYFEIEVEEIAKASLNEFIDEGHLNQSNPYTEFQKYEKLFDTNKYPKLEKQADLTETLNASEVLADTIHSALFKELTPLCQTHLLHHERANYIHTGCKHCTAPPKPKKLKMIPDHDFVKGEDFATRHKKIISQMHTDERKNHLVLMKEENFGYAIMEMLNLCPKMYSKKIYLPNADNIFEVLHKTKIKGISSRIAQDIKHEQFENMLITTQVAGELFDMGIPLSKMHNMTEAELIAINPNVSESTLSHMNKKDKALIEITRVLELEYNSRLESSITELAPRIILDSTLELHREFTIPVELVCTKEQLSERTDDLNKIGDLLLKNSYKDTIMCELIDEVILDPIHKLRKLFKLSTEYKGDALVDYTAFLTELRQKQHSFRSYKHQITLIGSNKVSLSAKDVKRWYYPDGINSLPHGHYKIAEIEASYATPKVIPPSFYERRLRKQKLEERHNRSTVPHTP